MGCDGACARKVWITKQSNRMIGGSGVFAEENVGILSCIINISSKFDSPGYF